jgi:membrane fusion protein (multidrug efflux system)
MPSFAERRLARPRWALGALLVAAALAGCDRAESNRGMQGPPPPVVEAATVESSALRDALDLVGQLESDESVTIRAETSGVVDAIGFEEGQEVDADTVLFRLRDDEQKARLAEAQAQLRLAEQSYGRSAALGTERILAHAELDRVLAERDAARARVELAKVELARMAIRAPFHGVLGRRLVSPGDRITPDTWLVQLDAIAHLKLVFTVPERILGVLRNGLPVTVRVAPFPDRTFPGEIFFVASTVDPRSRQVLAKAAVPNPTRELRPGLFAQIELETARRANALIIPESAVVASADGSFVWRLNEQNVAERAPIAIGIRRAGRVEVISGLAVGDRIVSAGTNKVIPGQPVQLAPAAAADAAGESTGG